MMRVAGGEDESAGWRLSLTPSLFKNQNYMKLWCGPIVELLPMESGELALVPTLLLIDPALKRGCLSPSVSNL